MLLKLPCAHIFVCEGHYTHNVCVHYGAYIYLKHLTFIIIKFIRNKMLTWYTLENIYGYTTSALNIKFAEHLCKGLLQYAFDLCVPFYVNYSISVVDNIWSPPLHFVHFQHNQYSPPPWNYNPPIRRQHSTVH